MLKGISSIASAAAAFAGAQSAVAWTPTLTFATPGDLAVTYAIRVGTVVKVGRLLLLTWSVTTSAFTFTTASGALQITGQPFTFTAQANYLCPGALQFGGITKVTYTQFFPVAVASASLITFNASGSAVAPSAVVAADTPTGGAMILRGMLVAETDS